jgi:uncharacterized protein with HEPN domain
MTRPALRVLLAQMLDAAGAAISYVEGKSRTDFLDDRRTQQAVTMNLVILGEIATRVLADHAEFVSSHPEIPWPQMRGMRNRIAHGYFEIDNDVVWQTVVIALPALRDSLRRLLTTRTD